MSRIPPTIARDIRKPVYSTHFSLSKTTKANQILVKCSAKHLPGYISNLPKLKEKGVDIIACIAFNDAWVMSAWGKANGIKDEIVNSFISFQFFFSFFLSSTSTLPPLYFLFC